MGETRSFGRIRPSDTTFEDDTFMSGVHFEVENRGEFAELRDLHSRNKTWLNNEPITSVKLNQGDTIRAGRTLFQVGIESPTSSSAVGPRPVLAGQTSPEHVVVEPRPSSQDPVPVVDRDSPMGLPSRDESSFSKTPVHAEAQESWPRELVQAELVQAELVQVEEVPAAPVRVEAARVEPVRVESKFESMPVWEDHQKESPRSLESKIASFEATRSGPLESSGAIPRSTTPFPQQRSEPGSPNIPKVDAPSYRSGSPIESMDQSDWVKLALVGAPQATSTLFRGEWCPRPGMRASMWKLLRALPSTEQLLVIAHFAKIGARTPESLDSHPVFVQIPDAMGSMPVWIDATQWQRYCSEEMTENLAQTDGLMIVLADRNEDPQTLCNTLSRSGVRGFSQPGGFMGWCWPSQLAMVGQILSDSELSDWMGVWLRGVFYVKPGSPDNIVAWAKSPWIEAIRDLGFETGY
jgi:pSer/pThr/pTyr-binding forkhead associated (FHA) protein